MTAQTSEVLIFKGKKYWVRDFIELPPTVSEPPDQMLTQSTANWQGFLCNWRIRQDRGKPRLFLYGFHCRGGYFPLFEPKLNPISRKVKVVPKSSELLKYVHMGFESKFSGEQYFVFFNGTLTDVQDIPDQLPNADGLLDLAKLHPLGEEEGLLAHRQATGLDRSQGVLQIHTNCIACGSRFAFHQHPDYSDPESETYENPDEMHCAGCIKELAEISEHLRYWDILRCIYTGEWSPRTSLYLVDVEENKKRTGIEPGAHAGRTSRKELSRWHRSSGVSGCGNLSYSTNKRELIFSFSGQTKYKLQEGFEFKDYSSCNTNLEDAVRRLISPDLPHFEGLDLYPDPGDSCVYVTKNLVARVQLENKGSIDDPIALAGRLETQVDAIVRSWAIERKRIGPVLRLSWANAVSALTGGTGIYPYNPADLTPIDSEILLAPWRGVVARFGFTWDNPWAIRPRHSANGWVLGETIKERYIKSLNL